MAISNSFLYVYQRIQRVNSIPQVGKLRSLPDKSGWSCGSVQQTQRVDTVVNTAWQVTEG